MDSFFLQIEGLNYLTNEFKLGSDATLSQTLTKQLTALNDVNEEFISAMYRSCAYIAASEGWF